MGGVSGVSYLPWSCLGALLSELLFPGLFLLGPFLKSTDLTGHLLPPLPTGPIKLSQDPLPGPASATLHAEVSVVTYLFLALGPVPSVPYPQLTVHIQATCLPQSY